MPIQKRFSDTEQYVRVEKAKFDPSADTFHGSSAQRMGLDRGTALPVLRFAAMSAPILPSQLSTQDLLNQLRMVDNVGDQTEKRYRDRITSPLTAIRAFCVSCKGGSPKQANRCEKMECPVWPFRLGQNSFYGRK